MKFNFKISNYPFWIFLSLILTGFFFWAQVYFNFERNQPLLGHFVTDSNEYYNSLENFYVNGVYSPDIRMPGLGVIFLPLRYIFSKTITLNIILVLQWLLSGIAAYILAITIHRATKKESVFYFVFFLVTITHFVFSWNTFYLTEGFCIPFFIFSLFYLNQFSETNLRKHLFLAGIFITWCVFLRPVFFLFFGIICISLLASFLKTKLDFKSIILNLLVFSSIFILCDSVWIARNYSAKNKIVFLNDIDGYTVVGPKAPYSALYTFMESWGGDLQNQMFWFEPESNTDYSIKDTTLPSNIYTSKFNKDSLLLVKERFKNYSRTHNDSVLILINTSLQNFTQSIKEEKTYLYYIGSGFTCLKKLILSGYGGFITSEKSFQKASQFSKIKQILIGSLFYFLFFTGILYSIWHLATKSKNRFIAILIIIGFVNLFYISFFFRIPEFRYLLPSILAFICVAGIALDVIWSKLKRNSTSVK